MCVCELLRVNLKNQILVGGLLQSFWRHSAKLCAVRPYFFEPDFFLLFCALLWSAAFCLISTVSFVGPHQTRKPIKISGGTCSPNIILFW